MKEKINQLTEAIRLNQSIYYNDILVCDIYLGTLNFKTGIVKVKFCDLETELVNINELEII